MKKIVDRPRIEQITQRIEGTPFGTLYVHIDHYKGIPVGGSISHPRKNEEAQVTKLIEQLSSALNDGLVDLGKAAEKVWKR